MTTGEMGYQGPIPAKGAFFDRVDVEGCSHSRTYWVDGTQRIQMVAAPDEDRPAVWRVGVRWLRRDQWRSHGWGNVRDENEALALLDAVAIGVEASIGGAMYIGAYAESVRDRSAAEREASGE